MKPVLFYFNTNNCLQRNNLYSIFNTENSFNSDHYSEDDSILHSISSVKRMFTECIVRSIPQTDSCVEYIVETLSTELCISPALKGYLVNSKGNLPILYGVNVFGHNNELKESFFPESNHGPMTVMPMHIKNLFDCFLETKSISSLVNISNMVSGITINTFFVSSQQETYQLELLVLTTKKPTDATATFYRVDRGEVARYKKYVCYLEAIPIQPILSKPVSSDMEKENIPILYTMNYKNIDVTKFCIETDCILEITDNVIDYLENSVHSSCVYNAIGRHQFYRLYDNDDYLSREPLITIPVNCHIIRKSFNRQFMYASKKFFPDPQLLRKIYYYVLSMLNGIDEFKEWFSKTSNIFDNFMQYFSLASQKKQKYADLRKLWCYIEAYLHIVINRNILESTKHLTRDVAISIMSVPLINNEIETFDENSNTEQLEAHILEQRKRSRIDTIELLATSIYVMKYAAVVLPAYNIDHGNEDIHFVQPWFSLNGYYSYIENISKLFYYRKPDGLHSINISLSCDVNHVNMLALREGETSNLFSTDSKHTNTTKHIIKENICKVLLYVISKNYTESIAYDDTNFVYCLGELAGKTEREVIKRVESTVNCFESINIKYRVGGQMKSKWLSLGPVIKFDTYVPILGSMKFCIFNEYAYTGYYKNVYSSILFYPHMYGISDQLLNTLKSPQNDIYKTKDKNSKPVFKLLYTKKFTETTESVSYRICYTKWTLNDKKVISELVEYTGSENELKSMIANNILKINEPLNDYVTRSKSYCPVTTEEPPSKRARDQKPESPPKRARDQKPESPSKRTREQEPESPSKRTREPKETSPTKRTKTNTSEKANISDTSEKTDTPEIVIIDAHIPALSSIKQILKASNTNVYELGITEASVVDFCNETCDMSKFVVIFAKKIFTNYVWKHISEKTFHLVLEKVP